MLKVYKRTIELCALLVVFFFSFAFSFYFLDFNFLANWLIGVGSSLIVVVITTYIQYQREKDNRISMITGAVDEILFQMQMIFIKGYSEDCERDYSEIQKKLNIIRKLSTGDLCLFSKRKDMGYERLGNLANRMLVIASGTDNVEKKIVRTINKKYFISLAKSAKGISKYDFEKEDYQHRIDFLTKIEKIRGPIVVYGTKEEYYQSYFKAHNITV